ncbi:uncharacterized protein VTP21DRAFT_11452 [Calcarisporiella thermophila]|uniref:uncharacterized protein n=1 Tax=Calcarisporiella thermophila TaxID=911321 RepID=UPI00374238D4
MKLKTTQLLASPISPSTPLLPLHSPSPTRGPRKYLPLSPRYELRFFLSKYRFLPFLLLILTATFIFHLAVLSLEPMPGSPSDISHQQRMAAIHQRKVDARYCGGPCKFLFPVWVGEQESKAQMHFQQLAILSSRLNRTIVLPNASKGRLGSCQKFPFAHYFSNVTLANRFPFITQETFGQWAKERATGPSGRDATAQYVVVERGADGKIGPYNDNNGVSEIQITESSKGGKQNISPSLNLHKFRRTYCIDDIPLRYDRHSTFRFHTQKGVDDTEIGGDDLVRALDNSNFTSAASWFMHDNSADVLLVRYNLRLAMFDMKDSDGSWKSPLVYDSQWYEEAMTVANELRPFIAVHWRMETVAPQVLPQCAAQLADYLEHTKKRLNIKNVYLATDYPLEGKYAHSSTWHKEDMTENHHEAIRILKEKIDVVTWLSLNEDRKARGRITPAKDVYYLQRERNGSFQKPLIAKERAGFGVIDVRDELTPDLEDQHGGEAIDDQYDPGLLGILDKITATQATYFVAGSTECAKLSSFTSQIVRERAKLRDMEMRFLPREGKTILNLMDQWS